MGSPKCPPDQASHSSKVLRCCWINLKELLGQPHSSQRKADRFFEPPVFRERDLAASTPEIDQKQLPPRARLTHQSVMNQPALFKTRDNLHVPAGLGLHPRLKCRGLPRIAHRRSRRTPDLICSMQLY